MSGTVHKGLVPSYASPKKRDMGVKSDKVRQTPPKTMTKQGVKSVNLTMGLENSNIIDILRKNPHHKILEWLENKNLGKMLEAII